MDTENQFIILLHGIGRDARMTATLEKHFLSLGYGVYNDSYLSTHYPIEELAERVYRRIEAVCPYDTHTIHFVAHSMGGLLVRMIISQYRPLKLGRVVMIAPPNHGSEVVDFMRRFSFYRKRFGPAGLQIGTDEHSIVYRLPPVDYELGIIAGNRSVDPFFSWFILPGPDDGKVTVASTKLTGMKDHIIIAASHPYLPHKPETLHQTQYFLEHGRFEGQAPSFVPDTDR